MTDWLTTAEAARYCGYRTSGGIQAAVSRGQLMPDGTPSSAPRRHSHSPTAFDDQRLLGASRVPSPPVRDVREEGRGHVGANRRTVWRLDEIECPDVWTIAQEPYPHAHFATFPRALVEPCILAGAPPDAIADRVESIRVGFIEDGEYIPDASEARALLEWLRVNRPAQYPLIDPAEPGVP